MTFLSQPRYIEVSRRNPITKLRVGTGSSCGSMIACENVCIEIMRSGKGECCNDICCYPDNPCGCNKPRTICSPNVAKVCATDIDDEGFAIFEWPESLYNFKEGWYEGHVMVDCYTAAVLPLRIGPRYNVLEVEHVVVGPDNACAVGCEDECRDTVCHPKYTESKNGADNYTPDYGA